MTKKKTQTDSFLVKDTKFKKGATPWNKGLKTGIVPKTAWKKGDHVSPITEFKSGQTAGEKQWNWKGDEVGYQALHQWVARQLGKPDKCEQCGSDRFVNWANKSGNYLRKLEDWLRLCRKCHHRYDQISQKAWITRRLTEQS